MPFTDSSDVGSKLPSGELDVDFLVFGAGACGMGRFHATLCAGRLRLKNAVSCYRTAFYNNSLLQEITPHEIFGLTVKR